MKFILASSSPRRRELLKLIGIEPEIIIPEVDESRLPGEAVPDFLRRVATAKGQAVWKENHFDTPVISSDTIVLADDLVIGKPSCQAEARMFMETLSGRVHEVWSGVSVLYRGESHYDFARTLVEFNRIEKTDLDYYMEKEDYMDKAGAYAIQGMASVFVRKIDGCYFNVMGFPLNTFYHLLKGAGIEIYRQK